MKFRHKPTIIEAVQYKPGMEDGLGAIVKEEKRSQTRTVYFPKPEDPNESVHKRMAASRFADSIERSWPYLEVSRGIRLEIKEGDWIVRSPNKDVMPDEQMKENYDEIKSGKQNKETKSGGRDDQKEDRGKPSAG